LPRFARLRSQQALEHGQKQTPTCSTRSGAPELAPALSPARTTPRRAKPVPLPASAPIKPAKATTVRRRRSARSPAFALHTACQRPPEHPPPWTGQPSHSQPRLTLERDSTCLGETPRARNQALPHRRHRFRVTGLHQIVGEPRPGSTVSLSSIPCTGRLLSTP
jgi:hypothetical protein